MFLHNLMKVENYNCHRFQWHIACARPRIHLARY